MCTNIFKKFYSHFHPKSKSDCGTLSKTKKSVPQECPTRVSRKSDIQERPARVSYKSVPRECPTRMSDKGVRQECPTRVSRTQECTKSKSVLQECPTRVSDKSVLATWSASRWQKIGAKRIGQRRLDSKSAL